MISNVYINGVEITSSNVRISSVRDSINAGIDVSDYKRGGRAGVALSTPFYRNFVINMEFWIFATSPSDDLTTLRDNFVGYLRLVTDKDVEQKKTFGFKMSNGVTKEVPAIISDVRSDITQANLSHSVVSVTIRTELEYFTSSMGTNKTISVYEGGGMPVPMPVPMSMASPIGGPALILNNGGNAEYFPTIKVNGPFTGFVLKNNTTGKQIDYDGTLTGSQYLTLDMYNRVALVNGTSNALADISGDWWWLQPGNNEILLITSSGSGNAEFQDYKDAYRGL